MSFPCGMLLLAPHDRGALFKLSVLLIFFMVITVLKKGYQGVRLSRAMEPKASLDWLHGSEPGGQLCNGIAENVQDLRARLKARQDYPSQRKKLSFRMVIWIGRFAS